MSEVNDELRVYCKTLRIAEGLVDYIFFSEGWKDAPNMTLEELAYRMSVFDDVYAWNPEKLDALVDDPERRYFFIQDFMNPDRDGAADWSDVVKVPDGGKTDDC